MKIVVLVMVLKVFLNLFTLCSCFFFDLDVVQKAHLIIIRLEPDRVLHIWPHVHWCLILEHVIAVVIIHDVLIEVIIII